MGVANSFFSDQMEGGGERGEGGVQSTKEEQTATVLLDLTRLSVWLHSTTSSIYM